MRDWIDISQKLVEKRVGRQPVMPLASFIARNGGLELDRDTRAADFHKLYVPGAGPLARKSGKSIDGFWRNKLADAGYLPLDADGYMSRDIRNELFDLLHAEQRARYFGTGVKDDQHDGESDDFAALEDDVRTALQDAGLGTRDPGIIHRTAMLLWNRDYEDTLDAYEHAAMATELDARTDDLDDIPRTIADGTRRLQTAEVPF